MTTAHRWRSAHPAEQVAPVAVRLALEDAAAIESLAAQLDVPLQRLRELLA